MGLFNRNRNFYGRGRTIRETVRPMATSMMRPSVEPVTINPTIVVDNPTTVKETAETSARPIITGRSTSIFGIQIVNASADTDRECLFLDALGAVGSSLGRTNHEDLTITSLTHTYATYLNELKAGTAYKLRKIVFQTSPAAQAQLAQKVRFYNYSNQIGEALPFDSAVPSSAVSSGMLNQNVFEHGKNWVLDGNKAGSILMKQDTTLIIYFHFD
jgi:hypothetical protein